MAKRMLVDAAHPEETRVVVTSGNRLEEFDFESSTKKQVKGNIYLAKVTRVEPSLQAAFVDYGGNRHGFLAFSEIHPDYYRIPVSDRPADEDDEAHAAPDDGAAEAAASIAAVLPEPIVVPPEAEGDDPATEPGSGELAATTGQAATGPAPESAPVTPPATVGFAGAEPPAPESSAEPVPESGAVPAAETVEILPGDAPSLSEASSIGEADGEPPRAESAPPPPESDGERHFAPGAMAFRTSEDTLVGAEDGDIGGPRGGAWPSAETATLDTNAPQPDDAEGADPAASDADFAEIERVGPERGEPRNGAAGVETFGGDEGDDVEEADAERRRTLPLRHYKIQEVIKRRQIMLVQVAKEERGNKGAALTTYLSLAGRYCVLMPNTNRGGGVSRKITSIADRRRLKDILEELDIPEGMGVIVRTAGAERSKAEIKRDYEYLLRLWNEIRELTLKSTAPALIYEEGNLIKRSIRDLYTRDIDEVLVEGEEGYKTAKAFMRTLMPSHAKRVQPFRDAQIGLFHRFQIESQIDSIHSPVAQLRSGGYIVINQTEALVAIDVNSGRSTRERNIEETALRTNLEAADEIARQLRLRDLAGLIVIDFIDMEEHRNQIAVERRLKDALKNDRARIQVGRISAFGLMEMSRQRLRPSLAEASTQPCPHCAGSGFVRSVESTALYVLRSIEEEGVRRRSAEICVYVPTPVALYILNQKRDSLAQIEARYGLRVLLAQDDSLVPPSFRLERLRPYSAGEAPALRPIQAPTLVDEADDDAEEAADAAAAADAEREEADAEDRGDERNRRRRRRRRPRRSDEAREAKPAPAAAETEAGAAPAAGPREAEDGDSDAAADRRRRRRGRRGGRVRGRREEDTARAAAETVEIVAANADEAPGPDDGEAPGPDDGEMSPPLASWVVEPSVEAASLSALAGEASTPIAPEETPPAPLDEAPPAPTAEAVDGIPFSGDAEPAFDTLAAAAVQPSAGASSEAADASTAPAPAAADAETGTDNAVAGDVEPAPDVAETLPSTSPELPPLPNGEAPTGLPEHPGEQHTGEQYPGEQYPGEDIHTVTETPTNPRRGWWRRLP